MYLSLYGNRRFAIVWRGLIWVQMDLDIVAASIFLLVTTQKLILLGATFTNVTLIGWRNGDSETRPWSRVKSVTLDILSSTTISCLHVAMCHLVPNSSLRPLTPSKDFLSVLECTKRVRNWKRSGVAIETFRMTLNSSYQQKHWMMSTQLSTISWKRKRRVCDMRLEQNGRHLWTRVLLY